MTGRTRIVIPCHDEARRLDGDALLAALDEDSALELVLVDDGSGDDTLARLEQIAARRPDGVEVVALPENVGKGEAVRAGIRHALEDGAAAYVGFFDADLATPLAEVGRLRAALEADPACLAAFGSRVKLLGREIDRRLRRHLAGRVAATLIANAIGVEVYDTQCGAKLFRAGPACRAVFAAPFLSRWLFDVEILVRCRRETGGRHLGGPLPAVVEVPVSRWHDAPGSKVGAMDYLRTLRDLARIRRHYGRQDRR